MDELRSDPITGRRVLIAEGRSARPSDYIVRGDSQAQHSASADNCPFCAGAEQQTPSPNQQVLDENGRWQVRVIPNKYPAVTTQSAVEKHGEIVPPFSPPEQAYGEHEVIIESPRHVRDITEVSVEQLATVLQVYRDRLLYWSADPRIRFAQIFKNYGYEAGASLEHVHSQVLAMPFVPVTLESELQGASRHYQEHKNCAFCDLVTLELDQRSRLIAEEEQFIAFCAYAGRQPYETWVMPTAHESDYRKLTDAQAHSLATVLNRLLKKLHFLVPQLSYNLILHTRPFSDFDPNQYHWHLEIVPRTTRLAGFEWGTGLFINPLSPESAAKILRETKV